MCVDNGGHAYSFKQILIPVEYRGRDNLLSFCTTNFIADAAMNKAGLKHYVGFNSLVEDKECRCYYSNGFSNKYLFSNRDIGQGAINMVDHNISSSSKNCFKYKVC